MMKNICGVDVGFGRVKGLRSSGKRVEFASLTGAFRPTEFHTGMERASSSICVEYKNRRYFVGEMRQAVSRATMAKERFVDDEGMVLMLTALALLAGDNREEIKVVSGLPVSYFSLKDAYRKRLLGKHSITMLQQDGKWGTDYSVTIDEVAVIPQPVGTLFQAILTEDGKEIQNKYADGKLAVLDIGQHTVDLAKLDSLMFVDRESTSYSDIGMFQVSQDLSSRLSRNYKIQIYPEEMEAIARAGFIKIGGKQIDIQEEIHDVYKYMAELIASRAKNTWSQIWAMDRIYITGGGSIALADHLQKEFGQFGQVEICPDATFTNCMGYLRYGNRHLDER